ncbi:hypothetical protein [Lactobacillus xujianguonis]|uniref:hypothetical protein n=1 Tax=Lactobacillus xujianguonis TaxID=2495899 RepID=UPI000FD9C0F5|nr:hypothetical protein [Lactobacillus xujianguonis]RVU71937.1 hypothetical protein EJK20_11145 [Lactobacillus xujianguonis]
MKKVTVKALEDAVKNDKTYVVIVRDGAKLIMDAQGNPFVMGAYLKYALEKVTEEISKLPEDQQKSAALDALVNDMDLDKGNKDDDKPYKTAGDVSDSGKDFFKAIRDLLHGGDNDDAD